MTISTDNYVSRYFAGSNITFFRNYRNGLRVEIETQRLYMRSVVNSLEDIENYCQLFESKDVVEKIGVGQVKTRGEVVEKIQNVWVKKWLQLDPFSAFSVFKKENKGKVFIGHVDIDSRANPGISVIEFFLNKEFWGLGYGKEVVKAVVNDYSRVVSQEGYLANGEKLKTMLAFARIDNLAAIKILEAVGMRCVEEVEKNGTVTKSYVIHMDSMISNLTVSVSA